MATPPSDDNTGGDKPFNIDMELPTTLPHDRRDFKTNPTDGTPVQVKKSTFLVRMPLLLSRGNLIKRLATIILPRHDNIAFLPHTSATHDKITNHELVPTDDMGIGHYIFDEKTFYRNRGKRNEFKMLECKIQIESPISLYQIKGANEVMELLMKHDIYVTAKRYCQAVSTKAIGLLMNLDAKRSEKSNIIKQLKEEVDQMTDKDVFLDLVPHKGLVRIGKKVIFGHFLKVMVDIKHATTAAKTIQKGLKCTAFGVGMKNVRLMPVYPIPNLMNAEMFGKMIVAHNDSMHGLTEIQVDNIWNIDTKSLLPDAIKKRFNLPIGDENEEDQYSLRDTIMPIFWGHFENEPVVRDVYVMRGRLMIVCEKGRVEETTKLVDMLLDFLKQEFNVQSKDLKKNPDKFAEWVGCSTPKNENRHPARSGTLIFGEGGRLKATVNSFLNDHPDTLPPGLVPQAGQVQKKPDLSRPPQTSTSSRGRTRPHVNPLEYTSNAANAWASAKNWTQVTNKPNGKGKETPNGKKRHQKSTPESIDIDNFTSSTVSMSSSTQTALDIMRKSVQMLENDRKKNDEKIETLDRTMEQIARNVTALSEEQRKSNSEYIQIKEQMLNIAKDSGYMKKEMIEMKDMIMCIATHLGGVRTDQTTQLALQQYKMQRNEQQQTMESTEMEDISEDDTLDNEKGIEEDEIEVSRKKLKQTHLKVFDTQEDTGVTTNRADPPNLSLQAAESSNGSNGNHSISEVDLASMYD